MVLAGLEVQMAIHGAALLERAGVDVVVGAPVAAHISVQEAPRGEERVVVRLPLPRFRRRGGDSCFIFPLGTQLHTPRYPLSILSIHCRPGRPFCAATCLPQQSFSNLRDSFQHY